MRRRQAAHQRMMNVVRLHPFPYPAEAVGIGDRFADRAHRPVLLSLCGARLAVQRNSIRTEVTDLEVEDLVDDVAVDVRQRRLFENQLAVDDQREQMAHIEQEVQILLLVGIGRRGDEELPERLRLLVEPGHVRNVAVLLVGRCPVGELHLSRAARRPLLPEEDVVGRVVAGRNLRVLRGIEHVVRHELQHQPDVDVDGALQPR